MIGYSLIEMVKYLKIYYYILRSNIYPFMYKNNIFDEDFYMKIRTEADFYGLEELVKYLDSEKTKSIKSYKKEYKLMNISEINGFEYINTNKFNFEIIKTIIYKKNVWNCTREIYIHDSPSKCGKICRRYIENEVNHWEEKNITEVLVCYTTEI